MKKDETLTKKEIVSGLRGLELLLKRNGEVRIADTDIFRSVIRGAYQMLKPEEAEMEGDRYNYFYVCPECHVSMKYGTRFCGSCGKEIIWK